MSFGVNFNNKPIIQEAKSMQNDGGAGNLGYFEREDGENENKKNSSIFDDKEQDSFSKGDELEDSDNNFNIAKFIAEMILAIKDWFRKIFN